MPMSGFLKIGVVAAAFVLAPAVSDAADTASAPIYRSAPPVLYDWTGFYVGAHIGAGWTDNNSGFVGGGQAGFNYQVGQWVLGVEGQLSGTSIKDSASAALIGPGIFGTASAQAS